MRVAGEHLLADVASNRHDGLIGNPRFGQFGNGVMPEVMEAQSGESS